jgi:site-specific DNA-adenine methylase
MRYFGGKGRVAKRTVEVISRMGKGRHTYIEPFVGGGYVLSYAASHFQRVIASDINPSLIAFWKAVINDGWTPPSIVTREEWVSLKASDEVSALKAWAGCAASYNARWFSSYGSKAEGYHKHDYIAEALNSLRKKLDGMSDHPNIKLRCCDYRELESYANSDAVVYCDPPYDGVTGYPYGGLFDHRTFWNEMADWSYKGALIFVHEFNAPNGWIPALSMERASTMGHSSSAIRDIETLWTNGIG